MAETIQVCPDAKCYYAWSDDCDCKHCEGAAHGGGINNLNDPIMVKKQARHKTTRRAFRELLNQESPRSGVRLYRRNREEFERRYAEYLKEQGVEPKPEEIVTVHSKGMGDKAEVTIIKDAKVGNDFYSHVRRANGKTEYRKNDKVCTKADIPAELGW